LDLIKDDGKAARHDGANDLEELILGRDTSASVGGETMR